jgi:hypothetical protein
MVKTAMEARVGGTVIYKPLSVALYDGIGD